MHQTVTQTRAARPATKDHHGVLVPVCFTPSQRQAAGRLSLALGEAMARTTGSPVVIVDGGQESFERGTFVPGRPVLTVIDGRSDGVLNPATLEREIAGLLRRCPYVILNLPVTALDRLDTLLDRAAHIVAFEDAATHLARLAELSANVIQFEARAGAEHRLVGEQRTVEARRGIEVYGQSLDVTSARPTQHGIDALARRVTGRRVGVALGCGAAFGFAHIGVLERLSELGVPIDVMTGTSAGAGIGTLWALGQDPDLIQKRFGNALRRGLRPTLSFRSLLSGTSFLAGLRDTVDGRGFEEMRLPLGVVAVDLADRAPRVFTSGDLPVTVQASCSVPGLWPAVHIDGRYYVDGGLQHPVPVEACAALGGDRVLAIDLTNAPAHQVPARTDLWSTLFGSLGIMFDRIRSTSTTAADLVIKPVMGKGSAGVSLDHRKGATFRAFGRAAVDELVPTLAKLFPEILPPRPVDVHGQVQTLLCA